MIPVPIDDRCRCIHPDHKGMCPKEATHVTSGGVVLCGPCADGHCYGQKPRELVKEK